MQITKTSDGRYTYTRIEKPLVWNDKMYFFPIPDAEKRKNNKLTQNPGW